MKEPPVLGNSRLRPVNPVLLFPLPDRILQRRPFCSGRSRSCELRSLPHSVSHLSATCFLPPSAFTLGPRRSLTRLSQKPAEHHACPTPGTVTRYRSRKRTAEIHVTQPLITHPARYASRQRSE